MKKVKWFLCLYAICMTTVCMASIKEEVRGEEIPAVVKLSYTVIDEDGVEVERLVIDLASDKSSGTVHFNAWTPEPVASNLTITVNAQYYSNTHGWEPVTTLSFVMPKGSNMVDKTFVDNFSTNVRVTNASVYPTQDAIYQYSVAFSDN